jgi:hypothetical protein
LAAHLIGPVKVLKDMGQHQGHELVFSDAGV